MHPQGMFRQMRLVLDLSQQSLAKELKQNLNIFRTQKEISLFERGKYDPMLYEKLIEYFRRHFDFDRDGAFIHIPKERR